MCWVPAPADQRDETFDLLPDKADRIFSEDLAERRDELLMTVVRGSPGYGATYLPALIFEDVSWRLLLAGQRSGPRRPRLTTCVTTSSRSTNRAG